MRADDTVAAMPAASQVLIEEFFETEDPRFLPELLASQQDKKLHHFAARWYGDDRPWARQRLFDYIADGCSRDHHRGLVRQLFRRAEQAEDDELMGHFLVAFDRLIAHQVKEKKKWDWQANEYSRFFRIKRVGFYPISARYTWQKHVRFSLVTRQYLRRRAFRYFRRLAFRDKRRYRVAALAALKLYREDHLERPEQLVDSWGLLHFLYHGSDVLRRTSRGVRIAPGRQLGEIEPAPLRPEAFLDCAEQIIDLAATGQALVIRRFAINWFKEKYQQETDIDFRLLRPLLQCPHAEVQLFAAELLERAKGLEKLAVDEWLALLELDNPLALPILCEQVRKCVAPERLNLSQCVELACARPMPVAELGLEWARGKDVSPSKDLPVLLGLKEAQAEPVRQEGAAWLADLIRQGGTAEQLRDLLDARYEDVRFRALEVLREEPRLTDETTLWAALAESPYDDARRELLAHLRLRLGLLSPRSVTHLWATTLLGIHRGSRTKRAVLSQLADALVTSPDRADELVPLLAVALRSVRPAEMRSALGAVARAAFEQPRLREALTKHVPELTLFGAEEAR